MSLFGVTTIHFMSLTDFTSFIHVMDINAQPCLHITSSQVVLILAALRKKVPLADLPVTNPILGHNYVLHPILTLIRIKNLVISFCGVHADPLAFLKEIDSLNYNLCCEMSPVLICLGSPPTPKKHMRVKDILLV